jgi:prepilin-type N-terminal cleavage/methylation domain-containing protein
MTTTAPSACRGGSEHSSSAGFTMIELMVVMGILVLAAGLMVPAVADFFKNRQLDAIRGIFGSVFSRTRLIAVTEGRDISVVFFREGARMYDELNKRFRDEDWMPETSPLAEGGKMWYVLGFARNRPSRDPHYRRDGDYDMSYAPPTPHLPPYRWWEQKRRSAGGAEGARVDAGLAAVDISGLFKVTFRRDGTMVFGTAATDVKSADYEKNPPERSDIAIYQEQNASVCFIDLRQTGQFRSRIVTLSQAPLPPSYDPRAEDWLLGDDDEEDELQEVPVDDPSLEER